MSLAEIVKTGNVTAKKYAKGETIFASGDPSDQGICIVLAGTAATRVRDQIKDQLFSREYRPGNVFGLLAVIGATRVETASALEDDTKILFINEEDFRRHVKQDEKFLANLFLLVLARLEAVPPSHLKAPDERIEVSELLGEKAAKALEEIKRRNLRILDYLNKMRNKFVSPGQTLFDDEESRDSDIYLLLEGEIDQFKRVDQMEVPVNTIHPGQIFGVLRGANQQGHALIARAGRKTAKLVRLDRDLLIKISHVDVDIAHAVFQNMVLMVALIEKVMLKE